MHRLAWVAHGQAAGNRSSSCCRSPCCTSCPALAFLYCSQERMVLDGSSHFDAVFIVHRHAYNSAPASQFHRRLRPWPDLKLDDTFNFRPYFPAGVGHKAKPSSADVLGLRGQCGRFGFRGRTRWFYQAGHIHCKTAKSSCLDYWHLRPSRTDFPSWREKKKPPGDLLAARLTYRIPDEAP